MLDFRLQAGRLGDSLPQGPLIRFSLQNISRAACASGISGE